MDENRGGGEIKEVKQSLENLIKKEEDSQGDKNIKYFLHHASQRKRENHIEGLINSSMVLVEEHEDIEVIYYEDLFTANILNKCYFS